MKHLVAAALLSVLSLTANAQSNGLPPTQAPAGNPEKFARPSSISTESKATPDVARPSRAPTTKAERRANRQAVRAARVGPKPLD